MVSYKAVLSLLFLLPVLSVGAEAPIKLRSVAGTGNDGSHLFNKEDAYRLALLDLMIARSSKPIELVRVQGSPLLSGQSAFISLLERGRLDIAWSMTSKQRESIALPVRVPIYRGLMGWRIGLIRADDRQRFIGFEQPEQLKTVVVGQGHDWPDTEILRYNGFEVETGLTWQARFKMLTAGRYDYFPRSILEVWNELEHFADESVYLDQSFAIYYPTAFYYFVNKGRPDLARLIEQGLLAAIDDGSFEELFMRFYGEAIEKSKLHQRKVLYLENPLLPEKTPINDERFWYQPDLKRAQ